MIECSYCEQRFDDTMYYKFNHGHITYMFCGAKCAQNFIDEHNILYTVVTLVQKDER